MGILQRSAVLVGPVTAPFSKEYLVCQHVEVVNSKGIFLGDNPLSCSSSILMAQLVLIFFVTRITYFFLRPLGQSLITAQVVGGIIIGPSFLGHFPVHVSDFFPVQGKMVLETVAHIGFMLHLFLLGIQMDASILKKAGRNAVLIGSTAFIFPYLLGGLTCFSIIRLMTIDHTLAACLPFIVAVNSMTSFVVVTRLLTDLNILNSEIGRLASTTSMVTDLCSWILATIMTTIGISLRDSQWRSIWSVVWIVLFLISVFHILGPLVLWIASFTPEGEPMKELHIFAIFMIVLGCGFCAEVLGQHAAFGPFLLGIALPDGPPLGTTLIYKLDTLTTGFLLPVFFAISGLKTNVFALGERRPAFIIVIIILLGYIGKFTGTILTALYCNLPFWDAISLGLIMCCKGIIEVATYITWKDDKILNNQSFTLLLVIMLIVTGITRPIIGHLYDPSKRYMAYTRRTILHSKDNADLRALVCIHNEENVPTMVNLLEASNPTRFSAISIFVLNLFELTGRASAVLVSHDQEFRHKLHFINQAHLDHIFNAFEYYEQHNQGRVMVQHFTAVAPYASMHDDICTVAMDQRTNIVILPFHKQWAIDGSVGATVPAIRNVNKNVINKAPCSVGVLIDRGQISGNQSVLTGQSFYRISLLFIGGADDREALAYSGRMAKHQNISLTVVWFKPSTRSKSRNGKEEVLDREVMSKVRSKTAITDNIIYKEEAVKDGVETTKIIRSMENDFDLFIVGKHHDPDSRVTLGFTADWSECPELGVIGDMLATSDFRFSVLVVQQQRLRDGLLGNLPAGMTPTGRKAADATVFPVNFSDGNFL